MTDKESVDLFVNLLSFSLLFLGLLAFLYYRRKKTGDWEETIVWGVGIGSFLVGEYLLV